MITEIKNKYLTVEVNSIGAEFWSIKDQEGTEYLWQGGSEHWRGRGPTLFPYIGRLTEGKYTYKGTEYTLPIHGFLPKMEIPIEESSESSVTYKLEATEETKKVYPFDFILRVKYSLEDNSLKITYQVDNTGSETMYFGIGGHPGFNVPLEKGVFKDGYLEFSEECKPMRVGFTAECFINGADTPYELKEDRRIDLEHSLFDEDAIVLKDMAKGIALKSKVDSREIHFEYKDMDYLGIWHRPHTEVNYVCVEPWSSLPGKAGGIQALEEQQDLISLAPASSYQNQWSITIKS
ncbi:aldose 1-epimerase family protein [Lachnospiraceae bacterium OttesenSCG-928-J05]|nr:aldose 1-epimerase family protein [Lachnospiraceae bacterium OttesenSCG-928-J05]